MRLYSMSDGLPDLDVRQVLEDSLGYLWVASEAGLAVSTLPLAAYPLNAPIRFTNTIGTTPLWNKSVSENRMCVDTSGRLWVGTREAGIVRYRIVARDSITVDTLKTDVGSSGKNRDVRSILVRGDGSVWAFLSGGKLVAFDPEGRVTAELGFGDGVPSIDSDAMCETGIGSLYGGCVNGIVWRVKEGGSARNIEVMNNELKSRITCITLSQKGDLWISSEGSGVLKLWPEPRNPGTKDRQVIHTRRNGLLNDIVNHVMEDREGNIWFSQIGGVSKLRSDYLAYTSYTPQSHSGAQPYLPSDGISAVVPPNGPDSKQGRGIWVATSGGGICLIDEDGAESIQANRGLKSDWVNALAVDSAGRLWVGTTVGINCVSVSPTPAPPPSQQRRKVKLHDEESVVASYGYKNSTIYSCKILPLPMSHGTKETIESIWFGAYQTLYCFSMQEWYVFTPESGLPATYFTNVATDSAGFVWVGTRDDGLYRSSMPLTIRQLQRFKTRMFQKGSGGTFGREVLTMVFRPEWNQSNGAPSNQIESILYHNGRLWIGSPEGLVALDPSETKVITHLQMEDGLPGGDVTSVALSEATGTLWLGTNGGLAEVDLHPTRILRSVTKQDGLIDNEVWFYGSVAVGGDGAVYFGTAKGLAIFKPHMVEPSTIPPPVRFEAVEQRESPASNEIVFHYAALSFANEGRVRYKTRMLGYEGAWTDERMDVTIRYTNLPAFFLPKTYTFQVLACNNNGVWTTMPLSYAFPVQPPWWFRWWSLAANAGLLAVVTYTFLHYRTQQLRRRSRELERIVAERTEELRVKADHIRYQADELASKNIELEEKNKEIIRTQEQLIVQEKLASLGALTAGIAHEIKNPLNFVNNFSELSLELAQELKEDLAAQRERLDPEIVKRIETTLHDLEENAARINEHGKRADGIVRGMLEHSRGSRAERTPTNINKLVDESVDLAYHGFRALDPSCAVSFEKNYDPSFGNLDVFAQDVGRVIINVVNNACYAVNEKKKTESTGYTPLINVSTRNLDDSIEIRIQDNGPGIPKSALEKIFNPFYTTKPPGKGTGLGLSLSHDIIVKQHGGKIEVETEGGSYARFIIVLPKKPGTST
jgi:signal transduction histidine kinase/ligand-binding sensor domain-containing protein